MDNTIIVNEAEQEGIGVSATFLITGENTYLQDLTLKNAYDYYKPGFAGRAVVIQDKGKHTVCKNVRMLSYQDTYYSNSNSNFYFENSDIHGTVDFICGEGDVFFNNCTLTVEPAMPTAQVNVRLQLLLQIHQMETSLVMYSAVVQLTARQRSLTMAVHGTTPRAVLT